MNSPNGYDAVVVGSGPNGLAAAITVAQAGGSVLVLEGAGQPGGGLRSSELTLTGFVHDECASVLALAAASPFFSKLPLGRHGLEWVTPATPLAHPLGGNEEVALEHSLSHTARHLGSDGRRYLRLLAGLVRDREAIFGDLLGPLHWPDHPLASLRFGIPALLPAAALARLLFRTARARALFAGLSAHSLLPLGQPATSAFALILAMVAHSGGWPFARGGSGALARALVAHLGELGADVVTNAPVASLEDLPPARLVFFDLTPRQLLRICGDRLDAGYRSRLSGYRYGPGVYKVDYALGGPIPWRTPACRRAGTVHLGASLSEIERGERSVWQGRLARRPFVIVSQPSLFDSSRAPSGCHTAWAYCHVPHGSAANALEQIEAQIERFAPGFGERVMARHVRNARELEAYNPNFVGGDINGGVQDVRQLFSRPTLRKVPYATSDPRIFICSSSTPPGGGVHGLCGWHAARSALESNGPLQQQANGDRRTG